ncbi:MAG: hypothetical protein EBV24_10595, partial [Actinobacteria bacterium]|nr:hypothetical protein [Actinomycetota bacterium]
MVRKIVGSVLAVALTTTAVLVASMLPEPGPAAAAQPRITLCHRTKSTTNPYRLITVAQPAIGNSGHGSHTGSLWTDSNTNGQTWGDIIPSGSSDANQFWSTNNAGSASSAINWSGSTTTGGKSFMLPGGTNLSKCVRMSALRFYEVMKAAGQTDTQIAADLENQEANEDLGIRPSGGWTSSNVATAVGSVSITTNSPTAIGSTTATLSGTIVAGTKSTKPYFEWGTTTSLGSTSPTAGSASASTGTINASQSLTGLVTNTLYYYRIIGIIDEGLETQGIYYGEIKSFTTGRTLRTVTLAVGGDSDGSATVNISSTAALTTSVSAGSAGSTTYNVLSGSLSCSISGSTLTTSSTSGTCKIEAVDAGDSTYSAATSATVTVTVAQTYTVTYDGNTNNGGSAPTDSTNYSNNASVTVATAGTLSKTGYTFDGWCTTQPAVGASCTGTSRAASSSFNITANTTLYAVWTANPLTVTYDANGGSTPSGGATSTVTGGTLASLATTSLSGSSFVGWFTAASGGTQVTTSAPHGQTANFTLYAQWVSGSAVTYNSNGGTGSIAATTGADGATVTLSSGTGFTRTGYTISSWHTRSDGGASGTSYALGLSTFTMPTGGIELFAQWTGDSLTVATDEQGGSAIGNATTTTGASMNSPGTPTRDGYSFSGWFTVASGGSAISFPYAHGQTANFTLYAQWTANSLTVTTDEQGGSAIGNATTTTGASMNSPGTP